MPKAKSHERLRAFAIYQQHFKETNEDLGPNEIAKQLTDEFGKEVSQRTVSGWKSRDKWLDWAEKEGGGLSTYVDKNDQRTSKESSSAERKAPKEMSNGPPGKRNGPPLGNNNAKGHGAPQGNLNSLGNDGGAPPSNENALKTGRYQQLMYDTLDDEERELWDLIPVDPLQKIDEQIRLLSLRGRRIEKNYQRFLNGLPEKVRLEISELRDVKVEEVAPKSGKSIKVPKKEMVVVQVQETEPRQVETAMMFWKHMSDNDRDLTKAIQQKNAIINDREKLIMNREKLDLDKQKANKDILGEGTVIKVKLPVVITDAND